MLLVLTNIYICNQKCNELIEGDNTNTSLNIKHLEVKSMQNI